MKTINARNLCLVASLAAAAAFAADANKDINKGEAITMAVHGGTATFISNTNVPGISVKGKSTGLEATVAARRTAEGLSLQRIDATLPVKALGTGMALRDEHMRKHIFTTADGQTPDIHFEGSDNACSTSGKGGSCQIAGNLTIRGVTRPFTLPLKVKEDGAGFKATGDGVVKLSAYGIEQPTQLGVKTADEVQLHFDFAAQPSSATTASLRGPQ
jgi:polyisoprenoid-binding protein YceI